MNICREAINNVLKLQGTNEPIIHCIVNKELLGDIRQSIKSLINHSVIADEEKAAYGSGFDGLLIGLNAVNNENILEIEKQLIATANRKKTVVLELKGLNLSIEKRNFAISFINRYNIDIIVGTKDELRSLISGQKHSISMSTNIYLDLAKKNNLIVVIKDDVVCVTDGYSEFLIEFDRDLLNSDENMNYILSGLLLAASSIRNSKEKKIESIVLVIEALKYCIELVKLKDNNSNFYRLLFEELREVDCEKLYENLKISYRFTR